MKTENLSIIDRMRLKNVKQLENIFMDIEDCLKRTLILFSCEDYSGPNSMCMMLTHLAKVSMVHWGNREVLKKYSTLDWWPFDVKKPDNQAGINIL